MILVAAEDFADGGWANHWQSFDRLRRDVALAAARKVATEFNAVFIPFQSMFDEATQRAPPAHWAGDGVHPTPAGACLMARTWVNAVSHARA
jgi:lysophospholipase L1-like esterase